MQPIDSSGRTAVSLDKVIGTDAWRVVGHVKRDSVRTASYPHTQIVVTGNPARPQTTDTTIYKCPANAVICNIVILLVFRTATKETYALCRINKIANTIVIRSTAIKAKVDTLIDIVSGLSVVTPPTRVKSTTSPSMVKIKSMPPIIFGYDT